MNEFTAFFAIFATIIIVIALISIIIYVVTAIGMSAMFKKAGRTGWHAFVPFFNTYKLCEIAHCKDYFLWIMILTFAVPSATGMLSFINEDISGIVNFVAYILQIIIYFKLNKRISCSFGYYGVGFPILLLIIPILGYLILGFNQSTYVEPYDEAYLFNKRK